MNDSVGEKEMPDKMNILRGKNQYSIPDKLERDVKDVECIDKNVDIPK